MTDSPGESLPHKGRSRDTTSLSEIRAWWEVPCVAHFCHTFSESLELPTFDIEELELALLPSPSPEATDTHPLLVGIHIAFLKGILEKKEIGPDNWELLLRLHFVWRSEFLNEKYSPMEEVSYPQLDTRSKVEILHRLCHLRMELDDITESLRSVEPCRMRVEELGADRGGHKLWYFYGMRLYRESKEAQQHNKRYKSSSSLRSRPADRGFHRETAAPSAGGKARKQDSAPSGGTQRRAQFKIEGSDLERGDSCVSADDSCRQEGRRVTRSARNRAANADTQETASCTEASSPVREPAATSGEGDSSDPLAAVGENEFSLRTGWSVICADLKDWDRLLSSLEGSPHACELELVRCVREELMESLTEIHTERSRTERFLALSERVGSKRTSMRLNNKLKASYQADQSVVGPPLESRCARVEEEEGSASDSCDTELEEERKRERDELRRRRTLEWEEAYSGNIQGPRKKSNLLNSALAMDQEEEVTGEDLRIAMLKVIDDLKKHEDCWLFVDPVTEAIAPGYHDVIKRPMDVVTVEKKLKNEDYSNKEQFVKDFRRIFKNCRRYNGADSEYTEMAHTVREYFNKLFIKHFSHPGPSRARSPIPDIGSSSESEAAGTPFKSPGVKRRKKRRAELTESMVNKSNTTKRPRKDQMRFARYPPPFYPSYPPFPADKDSGAMYPSFPHEYSPFPYFPPFMPSAHPPFPRYPLYWGDDPPHKGRSAPEGSTAGSTKERREEEARLQTVIRSQGLLAKSSEVKQKSEKVSSTTAEQKSAELSSLSSPESVPLVPDPPDPARPREDNGSKGSVDSRTSSCSSAAGVAPPPHRPRQAPYPASSHYGHMQHPFHHPYYAPPYMDYMMDPYYPGPPFFSPPGRHHRKHKHTGKYKSAERDGQGAPLCEGQPEAQQQQQQNTEKIETEIQQELSEKETTHDVMGPDVPTQDEPSSLAESDRVPRHVSPAATVASEEQPHSTTEEVEQLAIENQGSTPQLKSSPSTPLRPPYKPPQHSPYMYPHRGPYPPVPYPFYPPSPYGPHGYPPPPYDPYLADMMAWKQQQSIAQGMHSSKRKASRPFASPQMDYRHYMNSHDFLHRLPPFPGAPTSPEDLSLFYGRPHSPLSRPHRRQPPYETDVLPPPAGYSLQSDLLKLPPIDQPSNVPNYKDSLADYALHLAGGKEPRTQVCEDPLLQHQDSGTASLSTQEVPLEYDSHNNNNNNNNNITDLDLGPHNIGPFLFDSESPVSPPPSYAPSVPPPSTLRSFFLPAAPPQSLPSRRADLRLELLRQKQAHFNQWMARVSLQSRSRYACQLAPSQPPSDSPGALDPSEP